MRGFPLNLVVFTILWLGAVFVLSQLLPLVSDYSFWTNPAPVVAVALVLAWFLRPRQGGNDGGAGGSANALAHQIGASAIQGVYELLGNILRIGWSLLFFAFVIAMLFSCSQTNDPNQVLPGTIQILGQWWQSLVRAVTG